jgi:predicted RNA methylase
VTESASGYERQDLEKYFTPAWVTQALCSAVAFKGIVYDPACGAGHIIEAMRAIDVPCDGNDISPDEREDGQSMGTGQDFFAWDGTDLVGRHPYHSIVTNPPFGSGGRLAVSFIERALALTEPYLGTVAMLLRVDFDSAGGRRRLFSDHPAFAAKFVLTKRIRWANLPQSAAGPTQNHAWFVWQWAKDPETAPTISYLPRSAA